jgi:transposase
MKPIYDRCCGLDVHKKTVVACRLMPEGKQTRTFGTMTDQLLELRKWLLEAGISHVAMESTGVYWKPVFNLLEDQGMELLVVNARHVKAVPGRKTDVKDAEWLAELLQHGLLKASFIPDRESRERRELVRYRRSLVEQRAHLVQRIQKLLEGANIKLGDVASDVMGVSGRAMLQALAQGVDDPAAVAGMAKTALRNKIPELERALTGSVGHHQRFLLRSQFRLLESIEAEIASLDEEVAERMRPFQVALDRLDEIPGIGRRAAEQILVETGTDMTRFPSSALPAHRQPPWQEAGSHRNCPLLAGRGVPRPQGRCRLSGPRPDSLRATQSICPCAPLTAPTRAPRLQGHGRRHARLTGLNFQGKATAHHHARRRATRA